MSAVERIFTSAKLNIPNVLKSWDDDIAGWIREYTECSGDSDCLEIVLGTAVFVFDSVGERVVVAYALSSRELHARDSARMRGFPDVNVGVRKLLGEAARSYDRGHFLGHASGGELDINLFPQERWLNRGWSSQGKVFRRLERIVAQSPGTFFFHRPSYCDETWVPDTLEYGVLRDDHSWERARFANR